MTRLETSGWLTFNRNSCGVNGGNERGRETRHRGWVKREGRKRVREWMCSHYTLCSFNFFKELLFPRDTSSLRSSLGFRINKASTISRLFSLHPWTARRQLPKWTRTLAERIKEKERENTLLPVLNNGMRWAAVNKCVSTNCKRMRVDARTHTYFSSLFFFPFCSHCVPPRSPENKS